MNPLIKDPPSDLERARNWGHTMLLLYEHASRTATNHRAIESARGIAANLAGTLKNNAAGAIVLISLSSDLKFHVSRMKDPTR